MDNRKIADLTVDEFKALMEEMLSEHDPVLRKQREYQQYVNRMYNLSRGLDADGHPIRNENATKEVK